MSANTTSFQFFINLVVTKIVCIAIWEYDIFNTNFLLFFSQDRDINVIYVSGQDLKKIQVPSSHKIVLVFIADGRGGGRTVF